MHVSVNKQLISFQTASAFYFGFARQRFKGILLRGHKNTETCALLGYNAAFNGSSVPTFRDNLSVRSSTVKISKKEALFLDFLILEDGTDRLSRNVRTELPLNAA
jgi:hypothetical protein